MQVQIEHLVKLQAIELQCAELTKTANALPAEISRAETELAQAKATADNATIALEKEATLRRALESDIADHRRKVEKVSAQLDQVTTTAQATAIEHEIQFATSEANRKEEEEFASLERTEEQEAIQTKAQEDVASLSATLDTVRLSVARRKQEIDEQLATLQVQKEAVRAQIEPDLRMRFDRIVQSRGTGIASAENQQCAGCRMSIRPQLWNQLREGELLTCDNCNRMLYWNSALFEQN